MHSSVVVVYFLYVLALNDQLSNEQLAVFTCYRAQWKLIPVNSNQFQLLVFGFQIDLYLQSHYYLITFIKF